MSGVRGENMNKEIFQAKEIHKAKNVLEKWYKKIEYFLQESLALKLKPRAKVLKPLSCGINFLGYIIHTNHRLTRRRVVNNFEKKVLEFKNYISCCERDMEGEVIEKFRQTVNSYSAHLRKSDSYNLRKAIYKKNRWIDKYL